MIDETQILIPMAGAGSRFTEAGYTIPKPLLPLRDGRPMITHVIEDCLNLLWEPRGCRIVCAMNEAVEKDFRIEDERNLSKMDIRKHIVPALTEGAAATALQTESLFDLDKPLLIANSDQRFQLGSHKMSSVGYSDSPDVVVLTFDDFAPKDPTKPAQKPKWSYVLHPGNEILEKPLVVPAGARPTCGIYWFRFAGDFFNAVRRMIHQDARVNGEFYLAPAINFMGPGTRVVACPVWSFTGLGTPEDYETYMRGGPAK